MLQKNGCTIKNKIQPGFLFCGFLLSFLSFQRPKIIKIKKRICSEEHKKKTEFAQIDERCSIGDSMYVHTVFFNWANFWFTTILTVYSDNMTTPEIMSLIKSGILPIRV